MNETVSQSFGLLWLRGTAALLLFLNNGWPKITHYGRELSTIDDPLGLGRTLTLWFALFAEVLCPTLIAVGLFTRLACVPVIVLLLVAMVIVHREWTLAQGEFGWLYVIVFVTLAVAGPGRFAIDGRRFAAKQRR